MAEPPWYPPTMKESDRAAVAALAARLSALGLSGSLVGAIRRAVALAGSASDEDLKRGEL